MDLGSTCSCTESWVLGDILDSIDTIINCSLSIIKYIDGTSSEDNSSDSIVFFFSFEDSSLG
jgi:hypothetical protein